jgi:hypothetical protein
MLITRIKRIPYFRLRCKIKFDSGKWNKIGYKKRKVSLSATLSSTAHGVFVGYLYTEFGSQADYELVLRYAKDMDLVLYDNARDRQFFAKADGHAHIKQYIERRGG